MDELHIPFALYPKISIKRAVGAGVAELVDAGDLKSLVLIDVPVRVRPSVPDIL